MGNGALVFTFSAFALWMVARGYAKNLGNAWNTLTGAASGNAAAPPAIGNPANWGGNLLQGAAGGLTPGGGFGSGNPYEHDQGFGVGFDPDMSAGLSYA